LTPKLETIVKIAEATGKLLAENLNNRQASAIKQRKKNGDYSIEVDEIAERFVVESMYAAGFEGTIIAEENGSVRLGKDNIYTLYVDALDGSLNYSKGIPFFCVSIALAARDQTLFGVVFDPIRKELFVGERNKGARLNDGPIKQLGEDEGIKIISVNHIELIPNVLRIAKEEDMGIQMNWAVALNICYVACGRYSGAVSPLVGPWDATAAALIARETTAKVTNFNDQQWKVDDSQILASADDKIQKRLMLMLKDSNQAT
jgi:myo-inositol-1(or 4)-monophosphatase